MKKYHVIKKIIFIKISFFRVKVAWLGLQVAWLRLSVVQVGAHGLVYPAPIFARTSQHATPTLH